MAIASHLLGEFRRLVGDTRHSARGLGIGVTDTAVTSAIAEITQGHLIVTISGGTTPSIDFDLSNYRFDTVGKLYQVISRTQGYRATLDEDANLDHPSIDLEPFGPLLLGSTGVDLTHHLFSDFELEEVLRNATRRHNPSFTLEGMPPQEYSFILPLAQANICRIQAYDASKRKGMDRDTTILMQLAESFERQYEKDTTRLSRALQSPKEANSNTVDEGDVMLGKVFRRSLRTGFMSPISQTIPPDAAVLNEPDEHDVEDDNVRLVWQRNKNYDFYSYELWMDYRPDVVRTREGSLIFAGTPVAFGTGADPSFLNSGDTLRDAARRQTTSRMVFRSFGSNSNSSRSSFATFVEEFGQLIRSFAVSRLESDTTYYFRLYVIDINYLAIGSNIVRAKTKSLRSRFLSLYGDPLNPAVPTGNFIDTQNATAGGTVNVFLDSTKGAFTANHTLMLGEKQVTPTILNSGFTLQVVVPTFQNYGLKDLSVISPNQLIDSRRNALTVAAP